MTELERTYPKIVKVCLVFIVEVV